MEAVVYDPDRRNTLCIKEAVKDQLAGRLVTVSDEHCVDQRGGQDLQPQAQAPHVHADCRLQICKGTR